MLTFSVMILLMSFVGFDRASAGLWESIAHQTQEMLVEKCDTVQDPHFDSLASSVDGVAKNRQAFCDRSKESEKKLQEVKDEVAQDIYLANLAQVRIDFDSCARNFATSLIHDKEEFARYALQMEKKLNLLASLMQQQMSISHKLQVLSQSRVKDSAEISKYQLELQRLSAGISAIEGSMRLAEVPEIHQFVTQKLQKALEPAATIAALSSDQSTAPLKISLADFENDLKKALTATEENLKKGIKVLQEGVSTLGKSLSRATRERLAQDKDLIEYYVQENSARADEIRPIACLVNSRYGDGAEKRDQAMLMGTLALTAVPVVAGVSSMARAGLLVANPARLAASRGLISFNATKILVSVSPVVGGINWLKDSEKACGKYSPTAHVDIANSYGKQCLSYQVKAIENDDCLMHLALGALQFTGNLAAAQMAKSAEVSVKTLQKQLYLTKWKAEFRGSEQAIAFARAEEISTSAGMKTFRYSDDQVLSSRKKFPKIARSIDEAEAYIVGEGLEISKKTLRQVLKSKLSKDLEKLDPKIKNTMEAILEKSQNPKDFANYIRTLSEDSLVEMTVRRSKKDLALLEKGELSRNAMLKVIVRRQNTQGAGPMSTLTSFEDEGFINTLKKGPFFDKGFLGKPHGSDFHLLQRDYMSDVIWKHTHGNPKLFWDFIGTEVGLKYWDRLFDAVSGSGYRRPEALVILLKNRIPLK